MINNSKWYEPVKAYKCLKCGELRSEERLVQHLMFAHGIEMGTVP